MQGETATQEQVMTEFTKRHEINKARAAEEEDRKLAMKQKNGQRARRGENIANNVYMSMSTDLTDDEMKDQTIIKLNMKPYNQELAKTTAFFTDYAPE